MSLTAPATEENFRRAIVLLQMLLNDRGGDEFFEIEEEARQQLKDWGVKIPEARHGEDLEG
jgi:hypothetical protein